MTEISQELIVDKNLQCSIYVRTKNQLTELTEIPIFHSNIRPDVSTLRTVQECVRRRNKIGPLQWQVKINKPLSPSQISRAISLQHQSAKMTKELKPYTLKHIGVSKAGQHGIDKQTINDHARWTKDSIILSSQAKLDGNLT
ncbi:MAG: hypothetical protein EZS28_031140 [Streblomastix strix]|uniref:Uncharacterized protein n=1 Tax=Streblomastix strix TaxID=222440 RepID=A0A5J4UTB7_9EUKA|nr:MAG: hypothetical protein EZS28_031140 [Streblomastix strix]